MGSNISNRKVLRIVCEILTILGIMLLSFEIAAAAPVEEWNRTFGGSGDEFGNSVQKTADGGYIIIGSKDSSLYLIKTNALGSKQWEKTFSQYDADEANGRSVQQTSDGGYIILGIFHFYISMDNYNEVYLIKTDSSGNVEWEKSFIGGFDYDGNWAVQTTDGGYIITGSDAGVGVFLIKTDASGNVEWENSIGGETSSSSIQQTRDGGYIIAGEMWSPYSTDVYLVKTDSLGNKQWDQTFGGDGMDYGNSVQQTADGGYIIAGTTDVSGLFKGYLIKTDSSGNTQWEKTYETSINSYVENVQKTTDGGYILAGWAGTDTYSYAKLIKTDASGNEQWGKTFGGAGLDYAKSVKQTSDGGYIVAGYTNSFGAGGYDAWLVKIRDISGGITVASPNGGENWLRGTTHAITWTYTGNPGTSVKIDLLKNGVLNRVITSSTPNDRSHSWTIPSTQTLGADYKIRITSTTNPSIKDTSNNNFIISAPSITVSSPNGGENWVKGTVHAITWTYAGNPGTSVKIELLKNGVLSRVIASSTANDRSYSWTIPTTQTLGSDYKIRITSNTNSAIKDTSNNNFIISAPRIIVTSPNGGENWLRGTTHTIGWSSVGSTGTYVKIDLLKNGVLNRVIASSTPNDRSYGWTIPTTQTPGADYKIRVTSTANSAYTDTSNSNFIISYI